MNYRDTRKRSHRRGCRRNNRKSYGGGLGSSYSIGGPVAAAGTINNYDGKVNSFSSCGAADRPGYISGASTSGGLPGFGGLLKGGGEYEELSKNMQADVSNMSPQAGGNYGFRSAEIVGPDIPLAGRNYIGCGDSAGVATGNPLNQPSPVVPFKPMSGGRRKHRSRKTHRRRKQHGGVGGVDSSFYYAPRAGYTHFAPYDGASSFQTAAGTKEMINTPYPGQVSLSGACIKTGGGRKTRARKGRKSQRKGRKTYRRKH